MKSKYPSKQPCFQCKSTWKEGEEIHHINGKYWCSNPNCGKTEENLPAEKQLNEKPVETTPPSADSITKQYVENENSLLDIISETTCQHLRKMYPKAELNMQEVGMRTKEIYRKLNQR